MRGSLHSWSQGTCFSFYASAHLRLAQAQWARGLFVQSREAFRAALQAEPQNKEALLGLTRCEKHISEQLLCWPRGQLAHPLLAPPLPSTSPAPSPRKRPDRSSAAKAALDADNLAMAGSNATTPVKVREVSPHTPTPGKNRAAVVAPVGSNSTTPTKGRTPPLPRRSAKLAPALPREKNRVAVVATGEKEEKEKEKAGLKAKEKENKWPDSESPQKVWLSAPSTATPYMDSDLKTPIKKRVGAVKFAAATPGPVSTPFKALQRTPARPAQMLSLASLQRERLDSDGDETPKPFHTQDSLAHALAQYTQVVEKDPRNVLALVNRSLVLNLLGNYEEAARDALCAMALEPRSALCHLRLAQASLRCSQAAGIILAKDSFTSALQHLDDAPGTRPSAATGEEAIDFSKKSEWQVWAREEAKAGLQAMGVSEPQQTERNVDGFVYVGADGWKSHNVAGDDWRSHKQEAKEWLEKGQSLVQNKAYVPAVSALSKCLAIVPTSVIALCTRSASALALANVQLREDHPSDTISKQQLRHALPALLPWRAMAMRDALLAAEVSPVHGFTQVQLGRLWQAEGFPELARDAFLCALEMEMRRIDAAQGLLALGERLSESILYFGVLKKKGESGLKWFTEKK
eukprot:g65181.t1